MSDFDNVFDDEGGASDRSASTEAQRRSAASVRHDSVFDDEGGASDRSASTEAQRQAREPRARQEFDSDGGDAFERAAYGDGGDGSVAERHQDAPPVYGTDRSNDRIVRRDSASLERSAPRGFDRGSSHPPSNRDGRDRGPSSGGRSSRPEFGSRDRGRDDTRAEQSWPRRGITARELAMKALHDVDNGAFANLVLPEIMRGLERFGPIDDRDKAFATELVYGTVRMRRACDYLIQRLIEREPDPDTLRVLHLGAYQLVFAGVAPHAAVAETVNLAPEWSRGFANAVLRRLAGEITPVWPNMATELSYPDWIVSTLVKELGVERAERVLRNMNEPAEVYVREDGYVQDPASQVVAESVGAQPGERILDVCAAPGGKSTVMAAAGADVTAIDLHFHRARLVRRNAVQLGCIDRVGVVVADSTELPVPLASFDRVLLDAPCSGLGSLRRRPDARWRMEPEDVVDLVRLQKGLFKSAAAAVKPGGVLVYSVCTLTSEETTDIDAYVKAGFPDFEALAPVDAPGWEPIGRGARILPGITDGMAVFRYRRREK